MTYHAVYLFLICKLFYKRVTINVINFIFIKKSAYLLSGFFIKSGGEEGIRTLDTLFTYTRFPGVRLQPLIHLSKKWKWAHYNERTSFWQELQAIDL